MGDFTAEDLAREAEREVKMRERVYPRWVQDGRMNAADAERKIAMMREIAEILRDRCPPPAQGDMLG